MADTHRNSHIPVKSPRPSHNASLSSPLLGLVPPTRYPSVSGSPSLPSPASPSPSSPTGGGSTPFRSFRNFLSFGSNKHSGTPSPSAIPKSHFSTLGPVRRSVQVERRASSPQLNPRRSDDDYVLAIDSARPGGDKSNHTRQSKGGAPTTSLSTGQLPTAYIPSDSSASPSSPPALPPKELSTILESDTSGISKHLPSLSASQTSIAAPSENASSHHPSPHAFHPQMLHPPPRDTRHGSSSPSIDTSVLDFSTSKLTSEVLAALSESGAHDDWLHGVVVDDIPSDTQTTREHTSESPDTSFHLSALDPDLAALLSPNRSKGSTEPALLVAIGGIVPPSPSPPPSPYEQPAQHELSALTPTAETFPNPSTRRLPVASFSAAPRLPSAIPALSRITRSVSDRPALNPGPPSPVPIGRTASARALSSSPERPSSILSTPMNRLPRTVTGSNSARRPDSSGNTEGRKTAVSRLMTPARPSTSSAVSPRPPLSRLNSAQTSSAWEGESASPSSRPASSLGTASSRLQSHRPSLDTDRPRLTGSVRTRKRSTSVIENRVTAGSPQPTPNSRMTDWLGPRTAKAFAAAGLLDLEKDSPGSASRPSSRFGTNRSSIDRDSRSRYAPSRMAFSEAGSSSSWGARSGSISRAAGYSEGMSPAGPLSEATSTPRTAFSSASTAPTSISAASSMHHMQSEIQQLQEKHALETGALLNALADSQRTTRVLRDENGQLRDRIQMLEDKLADAQERIQQILYSQPPSIAPKSLYGKPRYGSPVSSGRRSLSHSRTNSLLHARGDGSPLLSSPEPPSASPETPVDSGQEVFVPSMGRKRMSGTSSVFPSLPSNMSMIMHEDGVPADGYGALSMNSSSPSGSPTMVYGRLQQGHGIVGLHRQASSRGGYSHRANRSVSSAGNISPTTASFSMVTGSPVSLNLRPEHELHLGDMAPLDLDGDEYEFDHTALR